MLLACVAAAYMHATSHAIDDSCADQRCCTCAQERLEAAEEKVASLSKEVEQLRMEKVSNHQSTVKLCANSERLR